MERHGYIVQERGYEYNDEYYYSHDDGSGVPKAIVMDEAQARNKMYELEVNAWRGCDIGSYASDMSDLTTNEEEFSKILAEMGMNDVEDLWNVTIPKDAPEDKIKRLIQYSKIRFFEILKVELVDSIEEVLMNDQVVENSKPGIFDSVDAYTKKDIEPVKMPEDKFSVAKLKEVISETEDDFLLIKKEMNKLKEEARSKVKNFFIKGMNKIFETHPEVQTVSWSQYTPYFNDGEECTFRANVEYFNINGYDEYGDESYYGEAIEGAWKIDPEDVDYKWVNSEKVYNKSDSKSVTIIESINSFLQQLDTEDYKIMFGDHAYVIVKKDEIIVEEYEHD